MPNAQSKYDPSLIPSVRNSVKKMANDRKDVTIKTLKRERNIAQDELKQCRKEFKQCKQGFELRQYERKLSQYEQQISQYKQRISQYEKGSSVDNVKELELKQCNTDLTQVIKNFHKAHDFAQDAQKIIVEYKRAFQKLNIHTKEDMEQRLIWDAKVKKIVEEGPPSHWYRFNGSKRRSKRRKSSKRRNVRRKSYKMSKKRTKRKSVRRKNKRKNKSRSKRKNKSRSKRKNKSRMKSRR
jgi:hypothetical protein